MIQIVQVRRDCSKLMDLLICRYWHRKASHPRLYLERHEGFPNLFFFFFSFCMAYTNEYCSRKMYLFTQLIHSGRPSSLQYRAPKSKKPYRMFTIQNVPPWNPASFATPCLPGRQRSICTTVWKAQACLKLIYNLNTSTTIVHKKRAGSPLHTGV